MDDDDIEAWWREREREGGEFPPVRRRDVERQAEGFTDDWYQCGRCGTILHVLTSECPKCGTCYGC